MNWKRQNEVMYPAGESGQHWRLWLDEPERLPGATESVEIKAHYHYNGSGQHAFGGAKKWPIATLEFSFKQGEEAKRDMFIASLQRFIESQL